LPEKTQELLAKVLKKADAIERKAPEASTMVRTASQQDCADKTTDPSEMLRDTASKIVQTASKMVRTASDALSGRSLQIMEMERMEGQLWEDIPGLLKAFTTPCCCWDRLSKIK
jgi:hypothetical protein